MKQNKEAYKIACRSATKFCCKAQGCLQQGSGSISYALGVMRKFWYVHQELCQFVKKGWNWDVAFIGTEATASKKESLAKSDVQHGKRDKTVRAFEIDTGAASISEREIANGIFDSTHWQSYHRNT